MSRTSHRWHRETCPICGFEEKVQNRSYRYIDPDGSRSRYTGYDLRMVNGQWPHRTTIHRLACARKHGLNPYEHNMRAAKGAAPLIQKQTTQK